MRVYRTVALLCLAGLLGMAAGVTWAGSTEPELAIADTSATVDSGVVTLEVFGSFDYADAIRLGYPLAIVVTQNDTVARLSLDGTVTVATGPNPPAPVPSARGVVAIAPQRLSAALPPEFTAGGQAAVRLEATYEGNPLRSNSVPVQW